MNQRIKDTIGQLLADAMDKAVSNGANSVSMPDGVFDALDERFRKDYDPTPEALALVRQRIQEKIALKPSWYRYEGKSIV